MTVTIIFTEADGREPKIFKNSFLVEDTGTGYLIDFAAPVKPLRQTLFFPREDIKTILLTN